VQFDVSELGGPVDAHKEGELAFGRLNLSNINVKVAERVGLELLLRRLVAIDLGQSADVVALQTAVQGSVMNSVYGLWPMRGSATVTR